MSNWGDVFVSVYDPSDLVSVITETDNGRSPYFVYCKDATGSQVLNAAGHGQVTLFLEDRDAYPLIQRGRIARVYQYSALASANLEIATFIIENVVVEELPEGNQGYLTISGPDLLRELQRRLVKQPSIAAQYTGTLGSVSTTIADLDAGASAVDDFYNGGVIEAENGSRATIEDYAGSARRCTLKDGWSSTTPTSGMTYTIYLGKATNDITQALGYASGWSSTASGTTEGTTFPLAGETVYDALQQIAKQSGEHFRLNSLTPSRVVKWLTAADTATINLYQVDGVVNFSNAANAPVISVKREVASQDVITRAYVSGGSGSNKITLDGLTSGVDVTVPTGWAVDMSQGLIINSPGESGLHTSEVVEAVLNFPEIRPETDTDESKHNAKIELFNAAVSEMQNASPTDKKYTVKTVLNGEVRPGQVIHLTYTRQVGSEVLWTVDDDLYVQRVTHKVGESTGHLRETTLVLTDSLAPAQASKSAKIARSFATAINHGMTGSSAVPSPLFGTTGVSVHSDLLGLSADDHPHYLLADGSRNLSGNLGVSGGVTIDGVDISAHAADVSAHHAPVTAGSGISLSGQQVSVADGGGIYIDGSNQVAVDLDTLSGLEMPAGKLRVKDGGGIYIDGTGQVAVDLATSGGLELSAGKLQMASPDALSSTSTNSTSSTGHTHVITATSDALSSPGALLKTDGDSRATLGSLALNTAHEGNAALLVTPEVTSDMGLYLRQLSGQTASLFRIEDSGGSALLLISNTGDLESGNPGFVSGLVGWQITHDGNAEFNNISARGELRATSFVSDEIHALNGSQLIGNNSRLVTQDELPVALDEFMTWDIEASRSSGASYFAVGDILRLKCYLDDNTTGYIVADVYVEVTAVGSITGRDMTADEPGYYPTTVRHRLGGVAGMAIPAGTAVVGWGATGGTASTYQGGLLLTADATYGPYMDVYTLPLDYSWGVVSGRTAPSPTPRVRVGNLDGIGGLSEQWGIAMGTDLSDTSLDAQKVVISDQQLLLQNVTLTQQDSSGNPTTKISPSGILQVGTDVDVGSGTFFVASATGQQVRMGTYASGKPNLNWDGATGKLSIRQYSTEVITLDSSGNSYFAGDMTIDTNGSISSGDTTFNSDGLELGTALLSGLAGMDQAPTIANVGDHGIKWLDGTEVLGVIYGGYDANDSTSMYLRSRQQSTGQQAEIVLSAEASDAAEYTRLIMLAVENDTSLGSATFRIHGDNVAVFGTTLTTLTTGLQVGNPSSAGAANSFLVGASSLDNFEVDSSGNVNIRKGLVIGSTSMTPAFNGLTFNDSSGHPSSPSAGGVIYVYNGALYCKFANGTTKSIVNNT